MLGLLATASNTQAEFFIDRSAFACVGTGELAGQPLITEGSVVIPPCLDGAKRVILTFLAGPLVRGSVPQAEGKQLAVLSKSFDLVDDLKSQQREAFLRVGRGY